MQIVIDIPEEDYEKIKKAYSCIFGDIYYIMQGAIAKGKPLPKGHGRLIDADELKKHKYHDGDRHENAVSVAQIDWQPTIIEAESEETE